VVETYPKKGYRFVADVKTVQHRVVSKTNGGDPVPMGAISAVDASQPKLPPAILNVAPDRRGFRRIHLAALSALILLIFLATGYVVNNWVLKPNPRTMTVTRIQGTEKSVFFSISPNGEYLAHNIFTDGKRGLTLTHLATNSNVQLVEPEDSHYLSITFTKSGSHIYFVKSKRNTPNTLYKIPILGGEPEKILENVDGRISFSPDGSRFAFYRRNPEQKTTSLLTAKADGTDEIVLESLDHPDHFSREGVAWSPDGETIIVGVYLRKETSANHLMAVEVATGQMNPLMPEEKWAGRESFVWLPDGTGLIAALRKAEMTHNQLYLVPYPVGESVRLSTGDISGFRTVSVTSDGRAVLAENYSHQTEIWHAGMNGTDEPQPITKERHHLFRLIRWAPDGRIVFSSSSSGNRDIWTINRDGTGARQVTADSGRNEMPYPASDNKHVVFISNRLNEDVYNVWRSELDGRNAIRLVDGSGEQFPVVTPDMKWVVYETTPMFTQLELSAIWKVPFDGGEPIQIVPVPSQQADISPDSQLVACTHKPTPDSRWKLAIFSIDGGPALKIFDLPEKSPVRWTPDGKAISYVRTQNGVTNLWAQLIDGGEPYQITRFKADGIPSYCDWSADFGLICYRGRVTRDAVLVTNFR
jgi:eukaryotic-like serine/threonine-protein kinase